MKPCKKSSGLLTQQATFPCLSDRLYTVADAQFGEDMTDMAFDGIEGNDQFLSNLLVGCSEGYQLQNFQFSLTQRLRKPLSLGGLFSHSMGLTLLLKGGKE